MSVLNADRSSVFMKHEPVSMQKFLRLCFGTAFRSSADVPKRTAERRVSAIPSDVPVLKKEECSAAGNFEGRRRFLALLFSASASFFYALLLCSCYFAGNGYRGIKKVYVFVGKLANTTEAMGRDYTE